MEFYLNGTKFTEFRESEKSVKLKTSPNLVKSPTVVMLIHTAQEQDQDRYRKLDHHNRKQSCFSYFGFGFC